ncbi:energy transducer TonB [Chryseobacterium ginsengisoli]|uniref:Energy transducer TonB n=1 Tax=Chryseobacterium ginsengisoli TaxID=363853 RepID=A0ABP9MNJ4_9FLAO
MKHINQNQEFRFNEVLFEHRNKEYGAYVLRNESDKILTKAFFIGVSLLAAISLTPVLINAFKNDVVSKDDGGVVINIKDPVIPDDVVIVPPKVQPFPQTTAPKLKTEDTTVPEPTTHVTKEKVVEKIEGAVAGIKNNSDGETAPTNTYVPPQTINTGPISTSPPPKIIDKVEDPNGIPTSVDVEATFMGGIDSFRNKVMNNFDNSGFESDGVLKTTITFIVEKDGTISGIKADGKNSDFNNEAMRTIKSIKGKWVPAKFKGQAVRSYFKFPMSMKFEE